MEMRNCYKATKNAKFGANVSQIGMDNFSDFYNFMDCPNYKKYAQRIKKSLYYGRIPSSDRPSLSVTGILVEKFSEFCNQDGLDNLEFRDAASICYDACVTPCSVIVALLYLDRLRLNNPEYLAKTSSSHVFVVAMMVASKYLYDDGEEDEVFNDEWATSAAMMLMDLNQVERNFLSAIDWNLFVDVTRFLDGLAYVEAEVSQREAATRGFFVYSDLVAISRVLPPIWNSLLNIVGSAFVVCIVGYSATIAMVATGAIVGKICSGRFANNFEPIYLDPMSQLTNQSQNLALCDGLEENLLLTTCNTVKIESDESICTEITFNTAKDVQTKSLLGKFQALHTLTTAFFLASSSAATKVADIMSSLPLPSGPTFTSLTSAIGPCLNCIANHSYPTSYASKKRHIPITSQASSKYHDFSRISYSRRRYQKEIDKRRRFLDDQYQVPSDGLLFSTNLLIPKKYIDCEECKPLNPANHNSGITVISIMKPRLANYLIVAANNIYYRRLEDNFRNLGLSENDETMFHDEFNIGHLWNNGIIRNYSQFVSPIKHSNDYLLDMELPWFSENKMSSTVLNLFTSWMWNSVSSTLSQNIHELISIGWQVQSMSLFI